MRTECMTAPLLLAQAIRCGTSSRVSRGSVFHVSPSVYLPLKAGAQMIDTPRMHPKPWCCPAVGVSRGCRAVTCCPLPARQRHGYATSELTGGQHLMA